MGTDYLAMSITWSLGEGLLFDEGLHRRVNHDLEIIYSWLDDTELTTALRLCGTAPDGDPRECSRKVALPTYYTRTFGFGIGLRATASKADWILSGGDEAFGCVADHFGLEFEEVGRSESMDLVYLSAVFPAPRDLLPAQESFSAFEEVHVASPSGWTPPSKELSVVRLPDEMRYILFIGWGDCPSGCLNGEYTLIRSTDSCGPQIAGRWLPGEGTERPSWLP